MSTRILNTAARFRRKSVRLGVVALLLRSYSRKVSSSGDPYKPLKARRAADVAIQDGSNLVWRDPSFELLASSGFPLFLRGDVGLAWYDTRTTLRSGHELELAGDAEAGPRPEGGGIELRVHRCPTVLRQTVCDLFPYRPLQQSELSVVSITLRPDSREMRANRELETERMAQTFLMAAKAVCDKLRAAGYWADFVNPFSGRPYLVPDAGVGGLYKTHERFRCLDFQIFEIDSCKVVSNEADGHSKKSFTGSLFTNAPCKKPVLDEVLSKK